MSKTFEIVHTWATPNTGILNELTLPSLSSLSSLVGTAIATAGVMQPTN